MDNKLYLLSEIGSASQMQQQMFAHEVELQDIIANNPNLLARSWDNGDTPRKLYVISREQTAKAEADGGNSFSLDFLLVDDTGIPLLVEVKRSTDTRIRREVVAQMLDYACRLANCDKDALRADFLKNNDSEDAAEIYHDEDFWMTLDTNLKAERFRLVFVADQIPETLRILIEFLDRSFRDIEVYGVELIPYQAGDKSDSMILSSNVIGNSLLSTVKTTSSVSGRKIWGEEEFCDYLIQQKMQHLVQVVSDLRLYAASLGFVVLAGTGAVIPSFICKLNGLYIFSVTITPYKSNLECRIEYNTEVILGILSDLSKDQLSSILTSYDNRDSLLASGQIRLGQKWWLINTEILTSESNIMYLKHSLSELTAKLHSAMSK